jgi:hypothetical protein
MRARAFLAIVCLALAGCATEYQPQGFTGGYSDFLTAPDEAVIAFHGNGFTSGERAAQMAALRCAEVTLEHGYRYFVLVAVSDVSSNASFTTPGMLAPTVAHSEPGISLQAQRLLPTYLLKHITSSNPA